MCKDDVKEVLIASILLFLFLSLSTGCTSIDVVHRPGKTPKLELQSKVLDNFCTKDFDADLKANQFVISCHIKI